MASTQGAKVIKSNPQKEHNELQIVAQEDNNPLPPIADLERLNAIRPDLVDRVADEAFLEAKHRREMEKSHFELMKKEASSNRWFVAFILITCLAVTTYLGWLGKELSAIGACMFPILMFLSNLFKRK